MSCVHLSSPHSPYGLKFVHHAVTVHKLLVISTDKGMVGKKIKMGNILVRFEVLTLVTMKLTDFNDVMLRGLVNVYSHFT